MRRYLLAVLILALMVLPLAAQEAPVPPKDDLATADPAKLGGIDVAKILSEAQKAYVEKRYEDAARAYLRALRRQPGDSTSLYDLACCYGLLGMEGQAARFLEAGWKAGFRDLEHIRRDQDFERVRESEAFQEVVLRLAEAKEAAKSAEGKRIFFPGPVLHEMRVVAPEDLETWKRYPLVIGLHGYGSNPESVAALFERRGIEADFLYCAIRAPYPFPLGNKIGNSWGPEGDALDHPEAKLARDLVDDLVLRAVAEMRQRYPVDAGNIFLLGFSQGAGMSLSVGLRHPQLFKGIIPIGGWSDPGEFERAEIAAAGTHALVLLCHSPGDQRVPYAAAERTVEFFREAGIRHRLVKYEGGHSIPKDLAEIIVSWIREPRGGIAIKKVIKKIEVR